jgi:hypothetical protein
MANWARGLASGLETGYRLGEVMQRGAERRALREAATAQPETLQGYTAEQGAQLEAAAKSGLYDIGMRTDEAGNFQGYTVTPKASPEMQGLMAPGQVTEMYGQRYEGALSPERVQGLRMGRMADVVAETDPIRAQQLRAAQAEQEFQAQYRPMQLESTRLSLDKGRREGAAAGRMDSFSAWAQANPEQARDFNAVRAKANELGMTPDEQFKIASNLTGIEEQEFKASQQRIQKLVRNQGLDGLLKAHKESNDLDPGSHFETIRGRDGTLTLNRVDTATGRVIQPNVFSGKEAEVVGYLNKAAMDPATIVDYTMTLRKNQAAISQAEASAEASRATVGLRTAQLNALQTQAAGNAEAAKYRQQFMELTPEEQAGAKGQGLIKQFNMANAKAGNMVPLGPATKPVPELSPAVMKRYEELVKSDRWQRAPNLNARVEMLRNEGIDPAAVGMADPADSLIRAMQQGGAPAAPQRATPAGQQILGLADVMMPRQAPVPAAPTTSSERLRGLYLGTR